MSSIAWNMLQTDFMSGPPYPILSKATGIPVNISIRLVSSKAQSLLWGCWIEPDALCCSLSCLCSLYIEPSILVNEFVDFSSGHAEVVVFSGYMTSVAWQV